MARKHIAKHQARLKKKHDQVRKKLFKLLQKVARHKGSWKPMYKKAGKGGFKTTGKDKFMARMKRTRAISQAKRQDGTYVSPASQGWGRQKVPGMPPMSKGGKGLQASGMGLTASGMGFTKRRGRGGKVKKRVLKKRKLPKWVTRKTVPRTFPKKHKDMTKAAGAFSDHMSKLGSALGGLYNKHKDTINKIGSSIGGAVLKVGTQFVTGKIQQAQALAQQKLQQANQQFNAHLQTAQSKAQMALQQAQSAAMGYGQQAYGVAQGYGQQAQGMAQGYAQQGQQAVAGAVQAGKTAAYDAAGNLLGYF